MDPTRSDTMKLKRVRAFAHPQVTLELTSKTSLELPTHAGGTTVASKRHSYCGFGWVEKQNYNINPTSIHLKS